jgi:putative membrane protein
MRSRIGLTAALWNVLVITVPVGLYSTLSLWRQKAPFSHVPDIPAAVEAGVFFAMGMLIAFRINRAYERWWEARTLWGTLVNVSRNLAVKCKEIVRPERTGCDALRNLIVAFSRGLRDHLRDEAQLDRLPGFLDSQETPEHIPSYIAGRIYATINAWKRAGRISDQEVWMLDVEARSLLDVCGACERIKVTLPSISWRWFTWQVILVFLLVVPWGLVNDFGYWTVPLSMLISYFVVGGEVIARFVEEPFGHHEDHLDLDAICTAIDKSVTQILATDGDASL